jgi:hypothetical protein
VLLALGCGSSGGGMPDAAAAGISVATFSMAASVAAGTEVHKCQFMTVPADASYVVAAMHHYTPGSHHMLLFRTDLATIPAGMTDLADCYEGSGGGGYMNHVRGVIYGSQVPDASIAFPTGVGLPLKAHEVVLFQSHYLNATDAKVDANVELKLTLSDGTGITQHAGTLFYYDPFIYIPAGSSDARAQMRCRIPSDVTVFFATSHFHRRGNEFAAYLDTDTAAATKPFYMSSDWDHPQTLTTPVAVTAGTRLRFSCGYDNRTGTQDYYQGQSAADNEMCVFSALYYPAMAKSSDELCVGDADSFGTGTAGCFASLTCLQGCPPGSASGLDGNGTPDVNDCFQRCIVQSCPDALGKVSAIQQCGAAMCPTECTDQGSTGCRTCVTNKCPTQVSACLTDSCQ